MLTSQEKKYKAISAAITVALMGIVLIALCLFGHWPPDPPIPESGVEVALGNGEMISDEGGVEPLAAPEPPSENVQEEISSQSTEEAPAIVKPKPKKKEEPPARPNPTPKPTPTTQKSPETPPKAPETPQPKAINPAALFTKQEKKQTTAKNEQSSTRDASATPGKPNGNPNATNTEGNGGSGTGGGRGSGGNGYSLAGRTLSGMLPLPPYNGEEEGKVVVKIWVDRNGNVIRAQAGVNGSTVTNGTLLQRAKQAAMTAKFTPNPDARETQEGTITYVFKRNR